MSAKPLLLAVLMLCSACAPLPPADIPPAPVEQARAVVFDIDGTLTPRVSAVFTARPDAARAVGFLAEHGYQVVYLSARVPWYSNGIPEWLSKNGFPSGPVHVAQTRADNRDPAPFKARQLAALIERGWDIVLAYGDSSTDFEAYAAAGIARDRVFALQRQGANTCQAGEWNRCLGGWTEHLDFLSEWVAR